MNLYHGLFRIIMQSILILFAIVLVIVTAMQSNRNDSTTSAIFGGSGGGDNFGSKNRNKTVDGRLALITKISAVVVMAFAVAIVILDKVLPNA